MYLCVRHLPPHPLKFSAKASCCQIFLGNFGVVVVGGVCHAYKIFLSNFGVVVVGVVWHDVSVTSHPLKFSTKASCCQNFFGQLWGGGGGGKVCHAYKFFLSNFGVVVVG